MKFLIDNLDKYENFEENLKVNDIEYELVPENLGVFGYGEWIKQFKKEIFEFDPFEYYFVGGIQGLRLLERSGFNCGPFAQKIDYDFNSWVVNYSNCFNKNHVISTYKNVEQTARNLNIQSDYFIRPLSGWKSFTGCATNFDDTNWRGIQMMMRNRNSELVVIAPAQKIYDEYRVFVDFDNEEVVTGSTYGWRGNDPIRDYKTELPQVVIEECLKVIGEFKSNYFEPAPHFFVDIHHNTTNNECSLIEIGSPHTCGLYGCDYIKFYKTIQKYYENSRTSS